MLRQYELVERVRAYDPTVNEALLNRAYVYAMQKHGAQQEGGCAVCGRGCGVTMQVLQKLRFQCAYKKL
jgi:(p)ppGpp synthase/HD superfamily hydrolase